MNDKHHKVLIPALALSYVIVLLVLEHARGGVASHYLLNNPDLPAISNYWGLLTLPLLGLVFAVRLTRQSRAAVKSMMVALISAFGYGVLMAMSFAFGAEIITSVALLLAFALGIFLPIYRIEYVFGFVAGMTFTFGGVLPLVVALVLAVFSFLVRYFGCKLLAVIHKKRA